MALDNNTCWETRPTNGDDTLGGGFVPGSGGTTACTSVVVDNTTNTKITSSHSFVSGDVNKYILITTTTGGWTPGLYFISSVTLGAANLDRSPAAVGTTGGAGTLYAGVDYSRNNGAQVVIDGTTINCTAAGASSVMTFNAGYSPIAGDVGNIVKITGGSANVTNGTYQITSVGVGVSWTLDRNWCTGAVTITVAKMGGPKATLSEVFGLAVNGNKIFLKDEGTLSFTAGLTWNLNSDPTNAIQYARLIGYKTLRHDGYPVSANNMGKRPTIQLSTNTGLTAFTLSGYGLSLENLIIDCNSLGTSKGIRIQTGTENRVFNCKIMNFTLDGIDNASSNYQVLFNEITAGTAAATAGMNLLAGSTEELCAFNNVHDNACPGIILGAQTGVILYNLIVNNTLGLRFDYGCRAMSNVFYGNSSDAMRGNSVFANEHILIRNNIFAKNGGWGINAGTTLPAFFSVDGNVYWQNTSGTFSGLDSGGTNKVDGMAFWATADIILTSAWANNPFTRTEIDATHANVTDLAVDSVDNTKVTSATYTFVAGDVGETLCISAGTGWTKGTYTISSVAAGAAFLTVSPAAISSTGGTAYFNDFTLNNTALAGTLLRATGYPGTMPGIVQTGKLDMGLFQHADPAGGGGGGGSFSFVS